MTDRRKVLELFEKQKGYMEDRITSGIETHRKGYAKIVIKDKDGNVVPDVKIIAKQKSHEFKFGANIFMLDELETKEKNDLYKKYFKELFNIATLPFYWDSTEPEEGKTRYEKNSSPMYRRPPIDLCMEFCEENGIEPREHALAFENFFPKWLYEASVYDIKKAFERRCKEISKRYAHRIPTIEVTNEHFWKNGATAFYYEPDIVEWCFKTAEKYFPANQLAINEADHIAWLDNGRTTDRYYACIDNNLLKGARIDAVGLQYHMFCEPEKEYEHTRTYYSPEELYKRMDLYSKFNLPLQVTEITIPAFTDNPEDEEIQAEIIEKLYSIWFSHPNMEQIIYWNLVDGYAHLWSSDLEEIRKSQGDMTRGENKYRGGLLRFDMSPKPAYYKVKELIQNVWHTEEEIITDENGFATFKGFYGKYDIEIKMGSETVKKEINLTKHSKTSNTFTVTI